jgi:hypothetical protein
MSQASDTGRMGTGIELLELKLAAAAKSISQRQRDSWKAKGYTLSKTDDSFPIPNVDYLKRAIQSFGRCPPAKRAALKAHIKARANALGATNLIPDDWS